METTSLLLISGVMRLIKIVLLSSPRHTTDLLLTLTHSSAMDAEIPGMLDSGEKQNAEAKRLASKHLGVSAINARPAEIQECFSKTFNVSLADG